MKSGPLTPEFLDEHLHEDVTFYSPVVFTPQVGKPLTTAYLLAAGQTLGGSDEQPFRYTKEIVGDRNAMLEFETSIGGKYVNGVDIITVDNEGLITEFKVLIRPLQGVNAIHEAMMAALQR
ncbi:MAG: nuclear transport factor 2 family protein [Acidimicrobiales bacterium]|nr:nuclear transport factor 2 family protein [Acidimicrobiales bacterium]